MRRPGCSDRELYAGALVGSSPTSLAISALAFNGNGFAARSERGTGVGQARTLPHVPGTDEVLGTCTSRRDLGQKSERERDGRVPVPARQGPRDDPESVEGAADPGLRRRRARAGSGRDRPDRCWTRGEPPIPPPHRGPIPRPERGPVQSAALRSNSGLVAAWMARPHHQNRMSRATDRRAVPPWGGGGGEWGGAGDEAAGTPPARAGQKNGEKRTAPLDLPPIALSFRATGAHTYRVPRRPRTPLVRGRRPPS